MYACVYVLYQEYGFILCAATYEHDLISNIIMHCGKSLFSVTLAYLIQEMSD